MLFFKQKLFTDTSCEIIQKSFKLTSSSEFFLVCIAYPIASPTIKQLSVIHEVKFGKEKDIFGWLCM